MKTMLRHKFILKFFHKVFTSTWRVSKYLEQLVQHLTDIFARIDTDTFCLKTDTIRIKTLKQWNQT